MRSPTLSPIDIGLSSIDVGEVIRTESQELAGVRLCVVSNEQPGRRMAGPAIRATEWARQLQARGAQVILATPEPVDMQLGVTSECFGRPSPGAFRRIARDFDVVVTQPQRVDVAAGLHRGRARVIYDCYVPSFVEYPASILAGSAKQRTKQKLIERNYREYATALECGDGFLVASQRQRDFLLGGLGQAGRLQQPEGPHLDAYPTVAVAPFGLSDTRPPDPQGNVLKGLLVPPEAVVALWAGGLWNWFDPLTVIRGLALARREDPRLHLVFMAGGHPSSAFVGQNTAVALPHHPEVAPLVQSGAVVFAERWVPHDERWAYLRQADVGVCAHYESPETHLSFRTRLLDHLWAGLPTLTTAGGTLSDLLCEQGAADCLKAEDPAAWADALVGLAGAPTRLTAMSRAAEALASTFTWSTVAEPVSALVRGIVKGEVGPKRAPRPTAVAGYLAVALENRLR